MNLVKNFRDWRHLFDSVSPFHEEKSVWASKIFKCVKDERVFCVKTGSAIDVWNEVNLIEKIPDHRNIIKMNYFVSDTICLVMRWCHYGDMVSFVQDRGPLLDEDGMMSHTHLFSDISSGLAFLHKCEYVHGDLKMENIGVDVCVDGKEVAKLIDLGKTCKIDTPCKKEMTLTYMSPEMVLFLKGEKDTYDRMDSESFLLGLVFYSMITNRMVFDPSEDGGMSKHYETRINTAKKHIIQRMRDPFLDVIFALLNTDPERDAKHHKRPTPSDVNQMLMREYINKMKNTYDTYSNDLVSKKENKSTKKIGCKKLSDGRKGILKCRNRPTTHTKTETCSDKHLSCTMV